MKMSSKKQLRTTTKTSNQIMGKNKHKVHVKTEYAGKTWWWWQKVLTETIYKGRE